MMERQRTHQYDYYHDPAISRHSDQQPENRLHYYRCDRLRTFLQIYERIITSVQ